MYDFFQQTMALSAAERAKKYRQNRDMNPERREKYLEYQRQKYKKDLQTGAKKAAGDMTQREHRHMKKMWKKQKQDLRRRAKDARRNITPPESSTGRYTKPLVVIVAFHHKPIVSRILAALS
jgi:hypothetical protein